VVFRAVSSLLSGVGLLAIGAALGYGAAIYQATGEQPIPLTNGRLSVIVEDPPDPMSADVPGRTAHAGPLSAPDDRAAASALAPAPSSGEDAAGAQAYEPPRDYQGLKQLV